MIHKNKIYKIRHKETGLFYQPTKGRFGRDKSNLNPKGKGQYYMTKNLALATLKDVANRIRITKKIAETYNLIIRTSNYDGTNILDCNIDSFEIVEFELKEIGIVAI
jgi:hypothetical protein